MRKRDFPIPISLVLFLAFFLAGVYFVRLKILERRMVLAIELDDEEAVRSLAWSFPCPVKAHAKLGETALHWAARTGSTEVARRLLARGADVHARDAFRTTPLHWAARYAQKDVAEVLIAGGADVHATAYSRRTPLHHAFLEPSLVQDPDDVSALGRFGPMDSQRMEMSRRRVRRGGEKGQEGVVRLLIAAGAGVNAADNDLRTPLHLAASREWADPNPACVEILLAAGADPARRNRWGTTSLQVAAYEGDLKVVEMLVSKCSNAGTLDEALLEAAVSEHPDVVSFLCSRRPNPMAPFAFWKAAEGKQPNRMGLKYPGTRGWDDFHTLWNEGDSERLIYFEFFMAESRPLSSTTWDVCIFDVHVFDATMGLIRKGLVSFTGNDYPYALVEVFSEGKKFPPALRGRWVRGLATLSCDGDWTRPESMIDQTKPVVLAGFDRPEDDAANYLTVKLIRWKDEAVDFKDSDLRGLTDVRFRWAETGPCVISNLAQQVGK
jgi:hypothetical protein